MYSMYSMSMITGCSEEWKISAAGVPHRRLTILLFASPPNYQLMTKSKRVVNFTFFTMNFTISMWISSVPTDCTTVDTLCPFDALNISFPDPYCCPAFVCPALMKTHSSWISLKFRTLLKGKGEEGGLGGWGGGKIGGPIQPYLLPPD